VRAGEQAAAAAREQEREPGERQREGPAARERGGRPAEAAVGAGDSGAVTRRVQGCLRRCRAGYWTKDARAEVPFGPATLAGAESIR
jgi:hypothetical protein